MKIKRDVFIDLLTDELREMGLFSKKGVFFNYVLKNLEHSSSIQEGFEVVEIEEELMINLKQEIQNLKENYDKLEEEPVIKKKAIKMPTLNMNRGPKQVQTM